MANAATVAAPAGVTDPNAANDSATDTDAVGAVADLSVTKSNGASSVTAGMPTAYSVVVSNAGPSGADGSVVTDPVAAGLAKTGVTCSAAGGAVCPAVTVPALESGVVIATLPSGGSVTFAVTASVTAAAGSVSNAATVTAPAGVTDPNAANDSAADTDTVGAVADLSVTKSNAASGVTAGTPTTYSVVVSNAGPSGADGSVVTDPAAAGLTKTGVTCSAAGGAVCPAVTVPALESGVAIPTLPSGGSVTFAVTADVIATTGSVSNMVTVAGPPGLAEPNPANNTATDTDLVGAVADLSVTKTDGLSNVNAGAATTYTVVVSNAGPSAADGAVVVDPAVAGLEKTAVSCAAAGGAVCPAVTVPALESGVAIATLPSGGSVTFTITATVTATAGSASNTATVTAPAGVVDPNGGNNSATDSDTVLPVADLAVTKTNGVTSITSGGTTTYTIVVSNNGPSAVTGATVTDAAPAGLVFGAWTCAASAGSSCPATGSGDLNATVTLEPAGTATFTVPATIASSATGTITNTVTVGVPAGTTDPTAANNSASDTDPVSPAPPILTADVSVTKTNGTSAASTGGTTTYTVVVSNAGPSAADGTLVTDPAVAGLTKFAVSCAAAGGAVCPAGLTVAQVESGVVIATMPALSAVTFTITADVTATSGTVSNTATAVTAAGVTDPNPANNSATDTDGIGQVADLGVTKTDGVPSIASGASTTYTVVVANAGPSSADGALVTDPAAAGLSKTVVSCSSSGGAACPAGVTVAQIEGGVAIPALPSGGSVTFSITATVTAAAGSVANTATVAAPAGVTDLAAANDSATDTNVVSPLPPTQTDLSVTVTNGANSLVTGASTTYTIVAANLGLLAADGAVLSSPAAAGLAGAALTCTAAGGAVCPPGPTVAQLEGGLPIPTLPSGGSLTFLATYTVTAASGAVTKAASVAPPAGLADSNPENNVASDTDPVGQAAVVADLGVTKANGVSTLAPGQTTVYTIVVSNAGPGAVVGARVSDAAPAGLTFGAWTCAATAGSRCPASGSGNLSTTVDLAVGGTASFTVNATVGSGGGESVTNTVTVAVPGGVMDANPANNSASDTDTMEPQRVGAAKQAGAVTVVGPTSFEVPFTITAANVGTAPLTNLQITDLVSSAFSAGKPAVTVVGAIDAVPYGRAPASACAANQAFTGIGSSSGTTTNLLAGSGAFGRGDGCTVRFTVRLTYPDVASIPSANQSNRATARTYPAPPAHPGGAALGPALAFDHSDSGSSPSGTNPGAPGDTGGSDDPTPVRLVLPSLDVTKQIDSIRQTDDTVFAIGFTFTLRNTGSIDAPNVQITDDLASTFSAGKPTIRVQSGPTLGEGTGALTVAQGENAFNGTTRTAMLDGSDTLKPGEYRKLSVVVLLDYPSAAVIPAGQEQPNTARSTTSVTPGGVVIDRDDSTDVTGTDALPESSDTAQPTPVKLEPRPRLTVEKSVSTGSAEIGDVVVYTVRVRNVGGPHLPAVTLVDTLPLGFRYMPGTARLVMNGSRKAQVLPEPAGGVGPRLVFSIPASSLSAEATLVYRVRVSPGALQGEGTNTVVAFSGEATSNVAEARVMVTGGVFTTDACVVGKIYVDCNGNRVQDPEELGIPGVRLIFEDGTLLVSDVEGKYSYCGLTPATHVLKADRTTLPAGSRLVPGSNRNAGDGRSIFVDLKFGEMRRADFIEGSCSERVLNQTKARRSAGEEWAPLLEGTDAGEMVFRGRTANQPVPALRRPVAAQGPGTAWQTPEAWTPAAPAGQAGMPAIGARTQAAAAPGATAPAAESAAGAATQVPAADTAPAARFVPMKHAAVLSSVNSAAPDTAPSALTASQAGVARIDVSAEREAAPANGVGGVEVVVRLFDRSGAPAVAPVVVTVETSGGRIQLPGRPTGEASAGRGDANERAEGVQIPVENGMTAFQVVAPAEPRDVTVRATVGGATAETVIAFVPELRPMVAVGLVEGMIGLTNVSGGLVTPVRPNEVFDRELRRFVRSFDSGQGVYGGRAAMFLKGKVKGDFLLTAAYDSDKDERGVLFRDIQPEAFYPVYGDSSLKGFDARTSGRFYARADRGRSYLLYGDLQTAQMGSETRNLGLYSRTLTGFQSHTESGRAVLNVFASRDTLKQVIDEFAALGVSGPYSVSNPNGVSGTEKVEIVTRDRNQPAVILSSVAMTRFADYEFEPFSGRLVFRRPVPAVDERLNPMSIRITYEVDLGGNAYWVGGADGQVRLGRRLEVGGSWNEDANPMSRYRLASVNAMAQLGRGTTIVAEGAWSKGKVSTSYFNPLGSANLAQTDGDPEGGAARVELRHDSRRLQARIFAGASDPAFDNPAASLNGGRAEAGARGALHFSDAVHVVAEAIHSEDRQTGGERDGALVALETKLSKIFSFEFGVRRARESRQPLQRAAFGLSAQSLLPSSGFGLQSAAGAIDPATGLQLTGADRTSIFSTGSVGGATGQAETIDLLTVRAKLTAKVGEKVNLYGEGEQDVRDNDRQLLALGGEFKIRERTRAYLRHEFLSSLDGPYAPTTGTRNYSTVFGVSSSYMKDGDLFSEYRVRDAFSGREAEAAIGLRNLWTLARGVRLSTGLERMQAVSGVDQTATAASLGLEYTRHPLFKGTGRVEWRHDPTADSWLSTIGVAQKISRDWTALAKNYFQSTSPSNMPKQTQDRFWVGAAFRDTDTNSFNMLSRYEFRFEQMPGVMGADIDQRVHVVSTHADYHPLRAWTFEGHYGAKWIDDRALDAGSKFSAHLVSGRAGYDLSRRWDLGALASLMWSRDAGRQHAIGVELGYLLRDNLWLSAGYNFTGFNDKDLFGGNYTTRGWFVRLRLKFDEDLLRRAPGSKEKQQ